MYTITFLDGSKFLGGDFRKDSLWSLIPNDKQIFEIEYHIGKEKIKLQGFHAYNQLILKADLFSLSGKNVGKNILKFILLCKDYNKIVKIIFDFKNKTVYKENVFDGEEFMGKKTTGWKLGVPRRICILKGIKPNIKIK